MDSGARVLETLEPLKGFKQGVDLFSMNYHVTPVRMAIIKKKTRHKKHGRKYGENGDLLVH